METGKTVVLLNLDNLYESLYDALNQVSLLWAVFFFLFLNAFQKTSPFSHSVSCRRVFGNKSFWHSCMISWSLKLEQFTELFLYTQCCCIEMMVSRRRFQKKTFWNYFTFNFKASSNHTLALTVTVGHDFLVFIETYPSKCKPISQRVCFAFQYYSYLANARYVDLGLGTHRVKCKVDTEFRCVSQANETNETLSM